MRTNGWVSVWGSLVLSKLAHITGAVVVSYVLLGLAIALVLSAVIYEKK